MSALFGLVRFDGLPVDPGHAAAMNAALAHRGTDERVALAGSAIMGVRGSDDAAIAVRSVVAGDRPRRIVVVADARLDGAEGWLESDPGDAAGATPADRILRSYLRDGEDVAHRLLGDFAFAIWDERNGKLTLARDPMGVKPLYLHRHAGVVAFASEIQGLLALPGIGHELDREQLALQLVWGEPDREGTLYRSIRRLPAAHALTVEPGALGRPPRRHWSLDGVGETIRTDPREYAEGLSEILALAVRDRMQGAPVVATALSGGLDSSTITCLARRETATAADTRELHAISLVFESMSGDDQRLIDERSYMRAVADGGGLTWHQVPGDAIGPLGEMDAMLEAIGQPFAAPNVHLHWQMYRRATEVGASVFLDGVDGDTAISHGFGRLNGHLARREWDDFAREVRSFGERDGRGAGRVLEHYGLPYLEDLAAAGRWAEWVAASRALSARFALSRSRLVRDRGLAPAARRIAESLGMTRGTAIGGDLLDPEIVDRLRSRGPVGREPRATLEREAHRTGVMQPAYQQTLEIGDACAARWGVTPRYPFFDRRVLEYCVSLPDEEKLGDGWSRLVLRRAMEGVLPPEVQWRVGKSNLSPAFAAALRGSDRARVMQADFSPLAGIVRGGVLEKARERLAADRMTAWGDADGYLLYRAVIAARWLESATMRTTTPKRQETVRSGRARAQMPRRRVPAA